MSDGLTPRQRRTAARREAFCRHYLVTLNAAEAARRAGYAAGNRAKAARSEGRKKDDGAKVVGQRLLKDPEVRGRLAELARAAWAEALWANHLEDLDAEALAKGLR